MSGSNAATLLESDVATSLISNVARQRSCNVAEERYSEIAGERRCWMRTILLGSDLATLLELTLLESDIVEERCSWGAMLQGSEVAGSDIPGERRCSVTTLLWRATLRRIHSCWWVMLQSSNYFYYERA